MEQICSNTKGTPDWKQAVEPIHTFRNNILIAMYRIKTLNGPTMFPVDNRVGVPVGI